MSERIRRTRPTEAPVRRQAARRAKRNRPVVGAPQVAVTPFAARWKKRESVAWRVPFTVPLPHLTFAPDKIVALILLVACSVGLNQMGNHDMFYVSALDVQGNALVPPADVEKASGIMNWNIFYIDPRSVENDLERLPEVKTALVEVDLPNVVSIALEERQPEFIWQAQNKSYWVDREGVALTLRRNINLPLIVDTEQHPVELGGRVNTDAIEAVAAWLHVFPTSPRIFEWSSAKGLAFTDEHGWKIYLGNARQMPEKFQALQVVTRIITQANQKVSFIDLGQGLPFFQQVAVKK